MYFILNSLLSQSSAQKQIFNSARPVLKKINNSSSNIENKNTSSYYKQWLRAVLTLKHLLTVKKLLPPQLLLPQLLPSQAREAPWAPGSAKVTCTPQIRHGRRRPPWRTQRRWTRWILWGQGAGQEGTGRGPRTQFNLEKDAFDFDGLIWFERSWMCSIVLCIIGVKYRRPQDKCLGKFQFWMGIVYGLASSLMHASYLSEMFVNWLISQSNYFKTILKN